MDKRIPLVDRGWRFVSSLNEFSETVMNDIMINLVSNPKDKPIDVSNLQCSLLGRVYGKEGFHDGDFIKTSPVTTIEQVSYGDFVVVTKSGSEYRIKHPISYAGLWY